VDFDFGEEQTALRELARQILEREVTPDRLRAAEAAGEWFDAALWSTLAGSNLLGVAIPEAHGGMGFGLLELCGLLEELGRAVAPVPAIPALAGAALPLARFGTEGQRARWLPAIAAGEAVLCPALEEPGGGEPARPVTRARREGGGWVLDGEKRWVAAADRARRLLVPAATGEGMGVFLVDPAAAGVSLEASRTSRGEPLFAVRLAGARVAEDELLGADPKGGGAAAAHAEACAAVATCVTQVGVSERAIEITAAHLRQREQFGAPIGSFPAVQQRAADCYIDLAAMRWTAWRAAWKLAAGLPAAREVWVARFWAAEGGSRIANAAQHLHGGLGVDVDYPIHRYFLWSKRLELDGGGATRQLARLGRHMREQPT
jgi:3-oxocholest-4-en-26-oyl-CoA dehydrogenase beta subunit